MARNESDREDLFSEAVRLERRLELRLPVGMGLERAATILIGARSNDWLSVYIDSDPVWHFDGQNRLRRAFVDGVLYRTQEYTLSRLTRSRTTDETTLWRSELTKNELEIFRDKMRGVLTRLLEAFRGQRYELLRRYPLTDEAFSKVVVQRLAGCLAADPWLAPAISPR